MFTIRKRTLRADGTPRRSMRLTRALLALFATMVVALGVALADPAPQPASAAPPAPTWFINWLKNQPKAKLKSGVKDIGTRVMEQMGYTCPAGVFSCYRSTNYDPPRWYRYGIVQTGNGPGGYVRARGWPGTDAPIIRTFPEGWKLVIFCQTTGPWVYGRWGWTNVWDYVGHGGYGGDAPRFVSDGFVYTGSNGFVAGDCGATNFGDNPFGSATAS